jgi:excisionase family DNA binding protein
MGLQGYLPLSEAIRKYQGISLGYLSRLVRNGIIEGERVGNQWLVKEDSLINWLVHRGKLTPPEKAPDGAPSSQG